jgi:23S rRNA (adenine2503-C2)-methyltransferase
MTSIQNASLFDLTLTQIEDQLESWSEPRYRAKQIWQWLYEKRVSKIDEMTNLSKDLREQLKANYSLNRLKPIIHLHSKDDMTEKVLFELSDGARIETVKMKYRTNANKRQRITLCISSQAGCALGCTFCATGQGGFQRHLTSGEIVEQVLFFMRALDQEGSDEHVTNIVYMGMGEPFHNYDNVMASLKKLTDADGIGLGQRRITVSTVGLAPEIKKFAQEGTQVNLAISLHSASNELRSETMPVNRRYPIPILLEACKYYIDKTNRRISFEWALIHKVNDTQEQAIMLAEQIKKLLCHVNLIPLNPTEGFEGDSSDPERIQAFRDVLDGYGIPNSIRARKGLDINAACGQLSQQYPA